MPAPAATRNVPGTSANRPHGPIDTPAAFHATPLASGIQASRGQRTGSNTRLLLAYGGHGSSTIPCTAEVCMARTPVAAFVFAALAASATRGDELRDAVDRAARAAE